MPTYCFIKDVYPSWQTQISQQIQHSQHQLQGSTEQHNAIVSDDKNVSSHNQTRVNQYQSCPNCHHRLDYTTLKNGNTCVQQNNTFQQKNYETALRPLPRWVPQNDQLQPWDPYSTRTFMYPRKIEHFGDYRHHPYPVEYFSSLNTNTAQGLIHLVFYLLILLFIVQFIELLYNLARNQ